MMIRAPRGAATQGRAMRERRTADGERRRGDSGPGGLADYGGGSGNAGDDPRDGRHQALIEGDNPS